MSPRRGRRPGTLHSPPGPAIDWCDNMIDALEHAVRQELTVAEMARRVGVHPNAISRGAVLLIRRYQQGRPV